MIKPILTLPDGRLRRVAAKVETFDSHVVSVLADMLDTVSAARGAGLAAPQIDVHERIVLVKRKSTGGFIEMINPSWKPAAKKKIISEEACFSIPGILADIFRFAEIEVRYQTPAGEWQMERCRDDQQSVAFQHEIDHLDGTMFIDHLPEHVKRMAMRKYLARVHAQQRDAVVPS